MASHVDPKRLRLNLGLTQQQFARVFEIPLGTLREWEQSNTTPGPMERAYLSIIQRDPLAVRKLLHPDGDSSPLAPTTRTPTSMLRRAAAGQGTLTRALNSVIHKIRPNIGSSPKAIELPRGSEICQNPTSLLRNLLERIGAPIQSRLRPVPS